MPEGLIHLYYGEGKGKTTAAMGLALRAAGCGKRVLIVQFLKGRPSGEVDLLQSLPGVALWRGKELKKFSWEMTEEEKQGALRLDNELMETAFQKARQGKCDLLVLDEALGACGCGLLDEAPLLAFLRGKPKELEVVLTGRGPGGEMLEIADYATEMRKEKHPYDKGVQARRGVEF